MSERRKFSLLFFQHCVYLPHLILSSSLKTPRHHICLNEDLDADFVHLLHLKSSQSQLHFLPSMHASTPQNLLLHSQVSLQILTNLLSIVSGKCVYWGIFFKSLYFIDLLTWNKLNLWRQSSPWNRQITQMFVQRIICKSLQKQVMSLMYFLCPPWRWVTGNEWRTQLFRGWTWNGDGLLW